jgi:hypothetical protein
VKAVSVAQLAELRRLTAELGFAEFPLRVPGETLAAMRIEAAAERPRAQRAEQAAGLAYRARIAPLPPSAADFLSSRALTGMLSAVFGGAYALTVGRSCLTFYEAGDRLGPHLDKPAQECELTIIVCLEAEGHAAATPQTGLELRVYGRQEPGQETPCSTAIATRAGAIVVGRGAEVWHSRPMLQPGERVAALTGCYGRVA